MRISRGVIIQSKCIGLKKVLLALMGFSVKCFLGTDSLKSICSSHRSLSLSQSKTWLLVVSEH